ncbi:MAG TPA: DinB family protein [Dehalococcoidia bacterium]|jgi:hypothetical protein
MVTEDIAQRVRSYMQHQATKSREAIIDLVSKSQVRYLDVISSLDDSIAAKKPAADEWSVRELTRHVISAQDGVANIIARISRGQRPAPGESPRGPGLMADDDRRPFAAYVEEVRAVNAKVLDTIRSLPSDADIDTKLTVPHPFFGELNCLEWAIFQRVHDEDHVQHSQKILAAVAG